MEYLDASASCREMVNWLRGCSKNEIIAVTIHINRLQHETQIPLYLPKENILKSLLETDRDVLWEAIEKVFDDADEEAFDEDQDEEDEDFDDE